MGCLTLPFRLLGLVLIVLVAAGAWVYRDEVLRFAHTQLGHDPARASSGAPGASALRRAQARVDSLERGRADSIVLGADEMASMLRAGLGSDVAAQLDSLRLTLGDGRIGVTALLRTARLPREVMGPLAVALKAREPIAAEGPLRVVQPGVGEWDIDRFRVRDIPLPREAIPKLLARAFGDSTRRGLAVHLPRAARAVRVRRDGVTFYAMDRR